MQVAQQNGWTVREVDIDDGCYKIEGRDNQGRTIEAALDPATLRVIELEYEDDDDDDDDGDDDRGAARNPKGRPSLRPH